MELASIGFSKKFRIHRRRALESAIRVMSMQATHGTVLEDEYLDEVGTAVGHTLEFYTLVAKVATRLSGGMEK
jgi:E3 ubiquitin-protein ligase TRIP12